jgi:hypothetical protein
MVCRISAREAGAIVSCANGHLRYRGPRDPGANWRRTRIILASGGGGGKFGRGPVVQVFARELAETVASNLEAPQTVKTPKRLGTGVLALRAAFRWLRELFMRAKGR